MDDTGAPTEISSKLGHLDRHDLEVQTEPTDALPLNRSNIHTIDGPSDVTGHLDHDELEPRCEEVQTTDVLDALDVENTVAETTDSRRTAGAEVVVREIPTVRGRVVEDERTVEVVRVHQVQHLEDIGHHRIRVGTRRDGEVRLGIAVGEVRVAVHRGRPTVVRGVAVGDARLYPDEGLLDHLSDAATGSLSACGVQRGAGVARDHELTR